MLFIKCVCVLKNGEADSFIYEPASLCVFVLYVFVFVLDFKVFIRLVDSHHKQLKALKLLQALLMVLIVVHQNGCYANPQKCHNKHYLF